MPEIPNNEVNCQTDGIMTTLAGVAGSLQANEGIKAKTNIKKKKKRKYIIFKYIKYYYKLCIIIKKVYY